MQLELEDIENLRHMLGATSNHKQKDWGFRNHFAAADCDLPSMIRLEQAGLVVRGKQHGLECMFYATEKSCKLLGFTGKQIKKALEK